MCFDLSNENRLSVVCWWFRASFLTGLRGGARRGFQVMLWALASLTLAHSWCAFDSEVGVIREVWYQRGIINDLVLLHEILPDLWQEV